MLVKNYIVREIPDLCTDKHYVYSYIEVLLGKGVNGGVVDDYIHLLLQNAGNKSIGLVQHHFFEYGDVGIRHAQPQLPDALFVRVSCLASN